MISYDISKEWLRSQLELSGISQKVVGENLGIDASAASRLLTGSRRLKFEELPKLVRLLEPKSEEWTYDRDLYDYEQANGRLEAALKVAGMRPSTLAGLLGIDPTEVERAIAAGDGLDAPFVRDAARLLGIHQGYLEGRGGMGDTPAAIQSMIDRWHGADQGDGARSVFKHSGPLRPRRTEKPEAGGPVPVYEAPRPLGGGLYAWGGRLVEHRTSTPVQGVADAWGLFVGEGGAPPRFLRGDVIYIHPHRPVRPTDFAVVRLGSAIAMGTVAGSGDALLDADGKTVLGTVGATLLKVAGVTFD